MNKTMKVTSIFAGLALAGIALTGCAASGSNSPTPTVDSNTSASQPSESTTANVIAPVTVDLNSLEGQTVEVQVGNFIYVNTGGVDPSTVKGSVEDSKIATFVPGEVGETSTTTAGFNIDSEGTTKATLIYGDTVVNFTIKATPKV